MRRPRWWLAALAWVALMVGLAFASPVWREFDWWLFAHQARATAPPLQRDLVLLDVPYDDDIAVYRDRLVTVMDLLTETGGAPKALVFDVQFVERPVRLEALAEAMNRLRQPPNNVRLFAVVAPLDGTNADPHYMDRHARLLYETALDGQGHTVFDQAQGLAKYDPLLDLGGGQRVPALAVTVAEALFNRPPNADTRPIVVRMGQPEDLRPRSLRFDLATQGLVGTLAGTSLAGRIVVLGSLERDQPLGNGLSGPAYLAWAISARGLPPEQAESRVEFGPGLLALLVLLGGLFSAGLARWVYARFAASHSHRWLIFLAATLVPLAVLGLLSVALASVGVLLPQITLPSLGVLLAAALAWQFVRRYLLWHASQPSAEPLAVEYDVFISYSRTDPEHGEWVRTQLVEPLQNALRPDGQPLEVFFDTDDLHPGDTWIESLYHAIDASHFFVPVYSADYFKKDFCKREIAHALKRQRTDNVFILPVDVAGIKIPSPYDNVQAVSVNLHPHDFVQRLMEAMRRATQAEAAALAAARQDAATGATGSSAG